jgi:hypothetical protein
LDITNHQSPTVRISSEFHPTYIHPHTYVTALSL